MDENIYQKIVRLIEDNHFTIKRKDVHDSQSGWHGTEFKVYDGEHFIVDLSGNGFCFGDRSIQNGLKKIEDYLSIKNMSSIDDFKRWLYEFADKEEN